MLKAEEEWDNYIEKSQPWIDDSNAIIEEQKALCGRECKDILKIHLESCKHGCKIDEVSYECGFISDNGRCSHYYANEKQEDRKERYSDVSNDYEIRYKDAKYEYEKYLAEKEDRLDEFYYLSD